MTFFLYSWILYAAIGLSVESTFTALKSVVSAMKEGRRPDLHLHGQTMLWSIAVYGLSAAIGFHPAVLEALGISGLSWFWRGVFYTAGIFICEFAWGWILRHLTGFCPWHYRGRLAFRGYINLAYAPFWFAFGLLLERVSLSFVKLWPYFP